MATKTNNIFNTLKQYWGYDTFLYLQEETIQSILGGRDSVTLLPTGGGKSLCFQLPALLMEGMAVVISPLISLMKDQVDALNDIGIDAVCLNSSMTLENQRAVIRRIEDKEIKILYLSPERLKMEPTVDLLKSVELSFFVIDEAHCISHWGHDFRADYRNLGSIKDVFEGINVHSFTATATGEVQTDIVEQLGLIEPDTHIGNIDRANLVYRVAQRVDVMRQVVDTISRHKDEPGIIYCPKRKDVDTLSQELNDAGYNTVPYHAGMSDEERHKNQDLFLSEDIDIIVATIAFGMGIDRSNLRFIIHTGMPKSIEHYQQETGRAGRDGLPAACYMLYGGGDYRLWSFFAEKSPNRQVLMKKLSDIYNFCAQPKCRHKDLVEYFGQSYDKDNCSACDYCLKEIDMVEDALIIGQKILSCVARVGQRGYGFGAGHVTDVLKGKLTEKIESLEHHELSTFGIMPDETAVFIRYMIEQLVGQGYLARDGEYSTLSVTEKGMQLLRGELIPDLAKPLTRKRKKEISKKRAERKELVWGDIDWDLFQLLREKRAELARKQRVPAYIIFGDQSLQDMAAKKPDSKEQFAQIYGVGETKLNKYAEAFLQVIKGS
jgi:ATP-dependent DNA helicase RecQ